MPEGTILFFAGSDTIVRYLTCSVGNGGGHSPGPSSGSGCMELASGNNQHNTLSLNGSSSEALFESTLASDLTSGVFNGGTAPSA